MSKKLNYTAPAVLDDLALELEAEILGASVVTDDTTVETEGQKIETYDFTSDSSFNQVWE